MTSPIKQLRKEKGLTQIQLAHELGVDQASISKWESGKANPTKEYEDKLAEFFGVSVDVLLGFESHENFPLRIIADAAGIGLPDAYINLLSEYSIRDDFRRMVRLWGNLTELQRMELLGFAQGIMGREPNIDGGKDNEGS